MDEAAIATILAVQGADETLVALGWLMMPDGRDMECWLTGNLVSTDVELTGLAARDPASQRHSAIGVTCDSLRR